MVYCSRFPNELLTSTLDPPHSSFCSQNSSQSDPIKMLVASLTEKPKSLPWLTNPSGVWSPVTSQISSTIFAPVSIHHIWLLHSHSVYPFVLVVPPAWTTLCLHTCIALCFLSFGSQWTLSWPLSKIPSTLFPWTLPGLSTGCFFS